MLKKMFVMIGMVVVLCTAYSSSVFASEQTDDYARRVAFAYADYEQEQGNIPRDGWLRIEYARYSEDEYGNWVKFEIKHITNDSEIDYDKWVSLNADYAVHKYMQE